MVTVLWFRWEQCLNPFTMFPVKGYFKTGLSGHISNHVFGLRNFGNKSAMRVIFFFENVQNLNVDFENARKNFEKAMCF